MASTVKTVLVTGSSRGLGLAIATQYKRLGWKVIGTVQPGESDQKLRALTPYKIVPFNVHDECSIVEAATMALRDDSVDLLIFNAHINDSPDVPDATKAQLMQQFEEHTVAPLLVTQAFLPHLKAAAMCHGSAMVTRICHVDDAVEKYGCRDSDLAPKLQGSFMTELASLAVQIIFKSLPVDLQDTVRVSGGGLLADIATEDGEIPTKAAEKIVEALTMPQN